jgi:fatty-acid desaturase
MKLNKNTTYLWPFQVLSIIGIIYSVYAFSWQTILLFVIVGHALACIGELVGLHRYFAHGSFKVNQTWHIILVMISTLALSGPVVAWAGIHRSHHRHSDNETDPHSALHKGLLVAFFANWWYYKHTPPELISDYNNDPWLKFACDYYYGIHLVYILLLLIVNPYLLFPLYFYPGIIGTILSSTINTYLHRGGAARNSTVLAWIIGGDGHHKFHHTNPGKAIFPYPDIPGIFITLIRKD